MKGEKTKAILYYFKDKIKYIDYKSFVDFIVFDRKGNIMGIIFLSLSILGLYFIFSGNDEIVEKKTNIQIETSGNYNKNPVVTRSKEIENIRELMKERGKMQSFSFKFNKDNIIYDGKGSIHPNIMTEILLDLSDTGLPDGSNYNLEITGTKLKTNVSIPGRYKFLVSFSPGEQYIIVSGDNIVGRQHKYKIDVK